MLISFSLTALCEQTGDSTKVKVCYTLAEMNKIADAMVFAHEADSLRKVAEKQVQHLTDQGYALQMALAAKQKEVDAQKSIVVIKEDIITGKDEEIGGLRDINKKSNRKLKWTRIGWISTTAVLTYLILTK